ncbi:MAG: DUF3108 domain-containing protein [Candidatus Omnitrophota bacterium]
MRTAIIIFFVLLCFCAHVFAQELRIAAPRKSLELGEELHYSVEWLGVPVGKIILKVEGQNLIRGYNCYHITARAFPNSFLKKFYDIEYTVSSFMDVQGLFSVRFEKNRSLDGKKNYTVIDFDPEANTANFISEGQGGEQNLKIAPNRDKIESVNLTTEKIPAATQDLLSSFYYFRLQDIQEGSSLPINIYYNQRNWPVAMKVDKPFLREIRKKGAFCVVKVFPDSQINEYILGKRRFEVFVTCDPSRIPLEFKLNTALGPLYARLSNLPRQWKDSN